MALSQTMWHQSIKSGSITSLRQVLQRYHPWSPATTSCASQLPFIKSRSCVETFHARHLSSDCVSLPKESQIVICGGGIVGCSVAYHLAKLGWKDVVLLEQGSLTCGTTWHAVGLLGKLRSSATETRLSNYSVELYSTLEEETGLGTGFKRCGGLLLAQTKDCFTFLKRRAAIGRTLNIESEVLSVKEIETLWPLGLRTDDIVGGLWVPSEGLATSSDVCQSLARGATLNGVKIFEKVCVESVLSNGRSVIGVQTNRGKVKCEIFVNCGGQWAWEIGQKSDPKVAFPLHSTEHYYIVTKPIEGVPSMLPVLRDYEGQIFFREWSGGLMTGGFELEAIPIFGEGIPKKFEYQLLPENWEHFEVLMNKMLHRLPLLQSAEIRHMTNGPESFTADSRYLLGEVPELCNYYVAAGFNSSGIANAGGAGLALAEWITAGEPTMDLFSVDIRRFAPHHNNKRYLHECVKEIVGWHYLLRFPYSEKTRARRVRCSPLYSDLDAAGALWGDKMGWEVAKWFASPGQDLPRENGFGKPSWLKNMEQEYKACTDGVAVVDLTSLGLFEIESTKDGECENFLQWLCSNDVSIHVGKAVQTLVLNKHGGTELLCTVIRDSLNRFIMLLHDSERVTVAQSLISRNIPKDSAIRLRNIQSAYVILGVLGPNSRLLLQALTQASLDKTLFPVNSMKEIDLGYASGVKALRTTCFGDEEHEWQLLVPSEFAVSVYRDLMEAGRDMGIRNAGRFAVDCLRLERFIPRMGSELTPFTTPWKTGMKHMVNLYKNCDFVGKEALLESRDRLPKKRLVSLSFQQYDDENFPWGGEPILKNGSVVGSTTSSCYSFTSRRPVCLGFLQDKEQDLNDSFVQERHFEVDVAGYLFPVTASFL